MIEVLKVLKMNGEICPTRKHPFTVDNMEELEAERAKLEKHYETRVYFAYRNIDAKVLAGVSNGLKTKSGI